MSEKVQDEAVASQPSTLRKVLVMSGKVVAGVAVVGVVVFGALKAFECAGGSVSVSLPSEA